MPGVLQNQTKQATAPMIPCRPANKTTSNWSSIESTLQMSISSQCTTENDCNAKLKYIRNDRWYWRYWWWWPWFIIKLWIALQTVTGKSAKNYEQPMLRLSHLPNTLQGLHEKKIFQNIFLKILATLFSPSVRWIIQSLVCSMIAASHLFLNRPTVCPHGEAVHM